MKGEDDDRDDDLGRPLFSSILFYLTFPGTWLRYVAKLAIANVAILLTIVAHQKLKNTSVKVSAHVNSANTIQYIIHFTCKRKDRYTDGGNFYHVLVLG